MAHKNNHPASEAGLVGLFFVCPSNTNTQKTGWLAKAFQNRVRECARVRVRERKRGSLQSLKVFVPLYLSSKMFLLPCHIFLHSNKSLISLSPSLFAVYILILRNGLPQVSWPRLWLRWWCWSSGLKSWLTIKMAWDQFLLLPNFFLEILAF